MEEPRNEDASPNGMAMTFIEERTSAFFGESSNMNLARLLFRAATAVSPRAYALQNTTSRDHTLAEIHVASLPVREPSPPSDELDSCITTLPTIQVMDGLLDVYFNTCGVVFPFIHEASMRETYAECKSTGFRRARRTWLGTLNMMFAIATKFDQENGHGASAFTRHNTSDLFYQRAVGLCGALSTRVISLEVVQYLILVVIFCNGTQRSSQAWNTHGLLVRSAIALGLHSKRCREILEPLTAELRRRTWLVIYSLDKLLSIVFGRPAAVPDDLMATQKPNIPLSPTSPDATNGDGDLSGDFLAVSFCLYQIMSKSLAKQYGANMENNDLEPDELASLQASGEFRKMLRSWTAQLPPYLQICEPGSRVLFENAQINRLRVILTLRYHNVSILVHGHLFSTAIRNLFRLDTTSDQILPYLMQPVMAEAQECLRFAESTVDIVHSILTMDPTSKNNLGVGSFTLCYVFTAALVISGRLLWAKHGQTPADEPALASSQAYLEKAEQVFSVLKIYDPLSLSCSRYIRNLSNMYSQVHEPSEILSSNTLAPTDSMLDSMQLDAEGFEAFAILTSEIFDPALFTNSSPNLNAPLPGDGT
ncbi:hypothetical protein ACJQWK_01557 [Exserohilum turcicum]